MRGNRRLISNEMRKALLNMATQQSSGTKITHSVFCTIRYAPGEKPHKTSCPENVNPQGLSLSLEGLALKYWRDSKRNATKIPLNAIDPKNIPRVASGSAAAERIGIFKTRNASDWFRCAAATSSAILLVCALGANKAAEPRSRIACFARFATHQGKNHTKHPARRMSILKG